MKRERYYWIDFVKCIACVLVVLGHLYMSLMAKGWIDERAFYYVWPIQTVYAFHVPLFFVCSGFLYQTQCKNCDLQEHFSSIKKKALNLGVPYFVFSVVTLMLKMLFPGEVNNAATPVVKTLLLDPIAPYWYLYILFFLFCLIPTFADKKKIKWLFWGTLFLKILYIVVGSYVELPSFISKIAANAIWFALGMMLTEIKIKAGKWKVILAGVFLVVGVILSISVYKQSNSSLVIQFIIAMLFVVPIVIFATKFCNVPNVSVALISKYFMPIYVLHTIFAAAMRSVLLKLGVVSLVPHIIVGLSASFLFPVIAYKIAEKHWLLLFWFEPGKALKMRKEKKDGIQKTH